MKKLFRRIVSALLLISAFAPSMQADQYVNLFGSFNGWQTTIELQVPDSQTEFKWEDVKLGSNGGEFLIKIWDGTADTYYKSNGSKVPVDGTPYITSTNGANMTLNATDENALYTVEFNKNGTLKVTATGEGEPDAPMTAPDDLYIIGDFVGCGWANGRGVKGAKAGNVFTFSGITFDGAAKEFRFCSENSVNSGQNYGRKDGAGLLNASGDAFNKSSNSFKLNAGTYDITVDFDTEMVTYIAGTTPVDPVVNCDGWWIKVMNKSNSNIAEVQLNNGNTIAEFTNMNLFNNNNTEFYIQVWDGNTNVNYSYNKGLPFNEWVQCVVKTSNMYDGNGNADRRYTIQYNAATNQIRFSLTNTDWTVPANLYLMGEGEGIEWGSNRMKGTKNGNVFTFYGVHLTGLFNFHEEASGWAAKRYGNTQNANEVVINSGGSAGIAFLKDQADKNFKVAEEGDYDVIVNFDDMTVTLREKAPSTLYMIGNTVGMEMKAMMGKRVGDDPESHVFEFNHIYTYPTDIDGDGRNGCFRFHTNSAVDLEDYVNFFGPADGTDEEVVVTLGTPMNIARLSEEVGRRAFRFENYGHYDITVDLDNMTMTVNKSEPAPMPSNLYIIGHVNTQQQSVFNFDYMNQTSRHSYREDRDGTRNPDGKVFVFENVLMRDNENTGLSSFTFRTNTSNMQWTAAHPDEPQNVTNYEIPYTTAEDGDQIFDEGGFPVQHFRIVTSTNRKGSWMLPSGYAYDLRVDFTDYDETTGEGDVRLYVKETVALPSELYLIHGNNRQYVTKMKSKVEGEFYLTNLNLGKNNQIGLSLDNGNNPDYCPAQDKMNIVLEENEDGILEFIDESANYKNNNKFWFLEDGGNNVDIFVTFPYNEADGTWDGADPIFRVVQRQIDESLIPEEIYLAGRLRDWDMEEDIDPVRVPKMEYDERDRTFTCTALLSNEPGQDYAEFRFYTSADAKTTGHEFGLVADSSKKLIEFDNKGFSTEEYAVIPATAANKIQNNWRVAGVNDVYLTFTLNYADPEHPVLTVNKEPEFLSFFFAGDLVTFDAGSDGKKSDQTWLTGDRKYQFQKSDLPDEALRSWKNGWYMLKLPVLEGQFKITKNSGEDNWGITFGHTAKKVDGDKLADPAEYFSNPVILGEEYTALTAHGDGANLHLANNVLENVTIYFYPDKLTDDMEDQTYGQPRLFITADRAYDLYYYFYNQKLMTEKNIKDIINGQNTSASDYIGIDLSKSYTNSAGQTVDFKMPVNRFYNTENYNGDDPTEFILVDLGGTDDLAQIASSDLTLLNFGLSGDRPEYDPRRYVMMAKIPSGLEMSAGIAYKMEAHNVGSNSYLSANETKPQTIPSTSNIYVLSGDFAAPVSVYLRQDYGNDLMNASHQNDDIEVAYRIIDIENFEVNGETKSDYVVVSLASKNSTLFKDADAWGWMPYNGFHKKGATVAQDRHNENVGHTATSATVAHDNIYHGHYPNTGASVNVPLNLGLLYPNAYVQFRVVRKITDWTDVDWTQYPDKLCKEITSYQEDKAFRYFEENPTGDRLIDYFPAPAVTSTASSAPAAVREKVIQRAAPKIPATGQAIGKDVDPFLEISNAYKLNSTPMYATVDTSKESITVGIEEINDDEFEYGAEFDGEPVYFTIEGIRVAEPAAPGIYIVVRGSHSEKIVVE